MFLVSSFSSNRRPLAAKWKTGCKQRAGSPMREEATQARVVATAPKWKLWSQTEGAVHGIS